MTYTQDVRRNFFDGWEFEPKGAGALTCTGPALLVALYLRGAPRCGNPAPHRWRAALNVCRTLAPTWDDAPGALQRAGLWSEAVALSTPGLVEWAHALVLEGTVLTAACESYPARWRSDFRTSGPPALWRAGPMPSGPFLGVVGSRELRPYDRRVARDLGARVSSLGYVLVSGGARGADRLAAEGASSVVEILPHGFAFQTSERVGCWLSAVPPWQPFTSAGAMERNALIYSLSEAVAVVRARFQRGGTWAGATDALRRRLTRVLVRHDPNDPAHRALVGLGAVPLRSVASLPDSLGLQDGATCLI